MHVKETCACMHVKETYACMHVKETYACMHVKKRAEACSARGYPPFPHRLLDAHMYACWHCA